MYTPKQSGNNITITITQPNPASWTYPNNNAMMTLQFRINVEPKISIITSITITLKPSPINSGDPNDLATSPLKHVGPGMGATPAATACAWFFQLISAHTTPPPQYFIPTQTSQESCVQHKQQQWMNQVASERNEQMTIQ